MTQKEGTIKEVKWQGRILFFYKLFEEYKGHSFHRLRKNYHGLGKMKVAWVGK